MARSPRAPENSGRTENGKSRPPACGRRARPGKIPFVRSRPPAKTRKTSGRKRKNEPRPRRNIPLSGWNWQRKSYPVRSRRGRPAFPNRRLWWRGLVCGPMDTAKSMRSNTKMLVWKEPTRPSFWRRPGRIRSAVMPSGVSGNIRPVRSGSGNGEQ